MAEARYPKQASLFRPDAPERDRPFEEAREEFLINYGYNTARAYWGDLEDLHDWCQRRGFDIFGLTSAQFAQYQSLLRRRRYTESTIRRRWTAWRGWAKVASAWPRLADNTAASQQTASS